MTTPEPYADTAISDRQALMDLLAGDGPAIGPTTYDRFEAWWYGAAANTRRAFAADMRAWGSFRRARGQPMIPAGAIDVRDFARSQVRAGLKASSIARHLASIAILHDLGGLPSPTRDRVVTGEMKGIRREEGLDGRGRRRQALPLRLKGEVGDIIADKPLPLSVMALLTTLDTTTVAGARDAVLLLLGTDLGRRRSEYAAMNVGDVREAGDGSGTMLIRRSKTDQSGEGRVKYLSPEAMAAIRTWLAVRAGTGERPLPPDAPLLSSVDRFGRVGGRLSDDGIRDVLLRIARRGLKLLQPDLDDAVIEDQCRGLSGHSLRVGFAQDLTAAGEGLAAICQAADWSSPAMPTRYAEALAARSGAVARLRRRIR
jgi:site-specific recombinase XerD